MQATRSGGAPTVRLHATHGSEPVEDADLLGLVDPVASFDGDVEQALAWAVEVGRHAPLPGAGRTALLWETLASTAALDVGVARILEPHLDALAILAAAGEVDLEHLGAGPRARGACTRRRARASG